MCKKCKKNKATETHNNFGVINNPIHLCKDCAILCGFRKK